MIEIGGNLSDAQAVAATLPNNESARAAAQFIVCKVGLGKKLAVGNVLLTDRRVILIKSRMIGRARIDHSVDLGDIMSTGCGPLMGAGPTWTVDFRVKPGDKFISMYFTMPNEADQFHDLLRAAAG